MHTIGDTPIGKALLMASFNNISTFNIYLKKTLYTRYCTAPFPEEI